jgi:hypothetical protein
MGKTIKLNSYPIPYTKLKSRWIEYLNIKKTATEKTRRKHRCM